MAVLSINENNFKEKVLDSKQLVMIDFFASWCGPCKMLSPVVEEVSEELMDVLVCSVNTEEEPALTKRYGIMTIPALVFIKNGEVLEKSVGYQEKSDIIKIIKKYL